MSAPFRLTAAPSSRHLARARRLAGIVALFAFFLLALRLPAFAAEGDEGGGAGVDADPAPRASDLSNNVSLDSIKLQQRLGDGTWRDVPAGTHLTSGSYVRIYLNWSIADMSNAEAGSTFTITVDGDDHLLASDFGPADLVDPGTGTVIGSYVVSGNRDADGALIPGQDISIITTLSAEGAQFPSLGNGFFSLEGYVRGTGDDIVFTVNGEALPSISIDPPTTGPLPGTPLLKYGSQVAGQNQIVWNMGVNLDRVTDAYADYAAGGSAPSAQQRKLLLSDELQGGQAITVDDVVVYVPVFATTDSGEAQTEQYGAYPITDLFSKVESSAASGMSQDDFAAKVRDAALPTIGVWEGSAVYIGFGNVPSGNGTSRLNIANTFNGQGEALLEQLIDSKGVSPAQKAIIMKYFGVGGPNQGDFTSFIVELRADASETGRYENSATLTYGDSSSETSTGSAHFTEISGGVEVRDGKAVLTKVDAGNAGIALSGAVFKLEKMQPDNSWTVVAGAERLTTNASGQITVTGLLLGRYRFVEVEPPAGYIMESQPIEFAIASSMPDHTATVTAENTKSPVLGKVVLAKVDADDESVRLPGAVFKLEERAADGTWSGLTGHEALTTDANGLITVEDLVVGSYRFVETAAPAGYVLDDTPREFAIDASAPAPIVVNLTAENAKEPPLGKAVLTKVDADDESVRLSGAVFKLEAQQPDGSWETVAGSASLSSDENGLIEAADLPMGSYRFVEVSAPEGYELETEPIEFALDETVPDYTAAVTAVNKKTPVLGGAVLTKVDADDESKVLSGASFKLEQFLADGTWPVVDGYGELVTDGQGIIEVRDLPVGSYRFVETAAPDGYVLDGTPVEFSVAVGQPAQVELAMKNAPVPPDPEEPVVPNEPEKPCNPSAGGAKPVSLAGTGDGASVALVAGAAVVSLAAAVGGASMLALRRRRR